MIALSTDVGDSIETICTLTCMASYEDPLTGEERYLYGIDAEREYPDRVEFTLRSGLPEDTDRTAMTSQFFEAVLDLLDTLEESVVVYAIAYGRADLSATLGAQRIAAKLAENA